MSATAIRAALDAHDALLRDCAEGRLTFAEFLGAYGNFPRGYGLEEDAASVDQRETLRLLRQRVAFHGQVAAVISGLGGMTELGSPEDGGVGDFFPAVGLRRLRELLARYPKFEAPGNGTGRKLDAPERSALLG